MRYICYIWKYGDKTAMLSRDGESFSEFKKRTQDAYPYIEGWHHQYSKFEEIW